MNLHKSILFIWLAVFTLLVAATLPEQCSQPQNDEILTESHPGWQKTNCETCHNLPVPGHSTSDTGECATCHGGNGACNPNGVNSNNKNHIESDNCMMCHGQNHGFTSNTACVNCHFVDQGVVDCM